MRTIVPLLVVPLLALATAASAAIITVNTLADELNNDGDCSFREAVTAAQTNAAVDACPAGSSASADLILFAPAVTGTILYSPSGEFLLTQTGGSLEIAGPGADLLTIDLMGNSRLFRLNMPTRDFGIGNLRIIGGSSTVFGGAIALDAARDLSFTHIVFEGSSALGGGAVALNGAADSVLFQDCRFEGNATTGSSLLGGGAIQVGLPPTAGLSETPLTTLIERCVFRDNFSRGYGGAIAHFSRSTFSTPAESLIILDSLFQDNSAGEIALTGIGGAVAVLRNERPVSATLRRSRFIHNVTLTQAGALHSGGGALMVVEDSVFSSNTHTEPGSGGTIAHASAGSIIELRRSTLLDHTNNRRLLAADPAGGPDPAGEIYYELLAVRRDGNSLICAEGGSRVSLGGNVMNDLSCPAEAGDLMDVDPELDLQTDVNGLLLPVPALDSFAVDRKACPSGPDIRGVVRPADADGLGTPGLCDAGAVELPEGRLLSVSKAGTGSGRVRSTPAGVDCLPACDSAQHAFVPGTVVSLTATAEAGSSFAGWSGSCGGTGLCLLTMSAPRSVTATFNTTAVTFELQAVLAGSGGGRVVSIPSGIDCPGACTSHYADGTIVDVTASADPGHVFTGWSGSCAGQTGDTCTLAMSASRTARANFALVLETTIFDDGFENP